MGLEDIDDLKGTLLNILPGRRGQYPFILMHQARAVLGRSVAWGEMQLAFDELYDEDKTYPRQNFSRSILRIVYR